MNISKVKVYGKAQNRTVLGIVMAYMKMHPETTASQLRRAFPTNFSKAQEEKAGESVKEKSEKALEGFFHEIVTKNDKRYWKIDGQEVVNNTFIFEQEGETIFTSDGLELAMDSVWTKETYAKMVEWAKQYDIEVAGFEETTKVGEKGGYRLEYLNGYVPPVKKTETPKIVMKAVEPVLEKPKQSYEKLKMFSLIEPQTTTQQTVQQPEKEEECCIFCKILCWLLGLLMLLLLCCLLFDTCSGKRGEDTVLSDTTNTQMNGVGDGLSDINGESENETMSDSIYNAGYNGDSVGDEVKPDVELTPDKLDIPDEEFSAPVKEEVKKEMVEIQRSFNSAKFSIGKSELSDDSKKALDGIIKFLEGNPNCRIKVVGHSSSDGDSTLNERLSEKRAKSVVDFLISQGVNPSQLTSEGKGSREPISKQASKNRRTEFLPACR